MSETVEYNEVRRIRVAPDGVHLTTKDGETTTYHPQDLELMMPNGDIVDIDQVLEAVKIKGYVSKH